MSGRVHAATDAVHVAVIGGGAFGREHVEAYQAVPGVELTAIVEPDDRRRQALEMELRTQSVVLYGSVEALLRHERIDAASVVTPGASHLAVTRELMTHGVDVLVEKPFADTVADAREIGNLARQLGRVCMPGHIMRHSPAHIELRDQVSAGALGKIVAASLRRDRSNDLVRRFPGVHPVLLTGVHDIDLALWITGQRVVQVSAIERRNRGGNVDFFCATLRHEHGAISTIQGAYLLPSERPTDVDDQIDVYGELGHVSLREALGFPNDATPKSGASNTALVAELTHFISCVSAGEPSQLCTPDDAVHVIDIAQAVARSAASVGVPVRVSHLTPSLISNATSQQSKEIK